MADSGRERSERPPNRICRWCDYRDHHGVAVHSLDAPTLVFEIALGRLVLNYSWERMVLDYEIAQGGLMLIGLAVLLFAPLIAATLRGANHSS